VFGTEHKSLRYETSEYSKKVPNLSLERVFRTYVGVDVVGGGVGEWHQYREGGRDNEQAQRLPSLWIMVWRRWVPPLFGGDSLPKEAGHAMLGQYIIRTCHRCGRATWADRQLCPQCREEIWPRQAALRGQKGEAR